MESLVSLHVRKAVAFWRNGNALVSTNIVGLCQAQLVLGWVTVCGFDFSCLPDLGI